MQVYLNKTPACVRWNLMWIKNGKFYFYFKT